MGKITGEIKAGNLKTDMLQQEIRRTEAQMSETLHTIEGKLSPAHIKEEMAKSALRLAVEGVEKVRHAMKTRSLPAIIGAGVVLLMGRKILKARKGAARRDKVELKRARMIAEALAERSGSVIPSAGARLLTKGLAVAIGTALGTALSRMWRMDTKEGQERTERSEFQGQMPYYIPGGKH